MMQVEFQQLIFKLERIQGAQTSAAQTSIFNSVESIFYFYIKIDAGHLCQIS